jgi:hypothetical protein
LRGGGVAGAQGSIREKGSEESRGTRTPITMTKKIPKRLEHLAGAEDHSDDEELLDHNLELEGFEEFEFPVWLKELETLCDLKPERVLCALHFMNQFGSENSDHFKGWTPVEIARVFYVQEYAPEVTARRLIENHIWRRDRGIWQTFTQYENELRSLNDDEDEL